EFRDPRGGACGERSGRDGVHADALRAEFGGGIAHRTLERRLGGAHDVVVLHHHLAAVLGHREGGDALPHHGLDPTRQQTRRPTAELQGGQKAVARTPDDAPLAGAVGREGAGVHAEATLARNLAMRSNTASIWPGVRASSGIRIGASSSRASGSTYFLALSLR